jgi:hypothetical protein
MENEIDQAVEETAEQVEEISEAPVETEAKEEKPKLTPEQQRGILKRKLTKLEKEMGIAEEKPETKTNTSNTPNEPDYAKKIDKLTLKSEGYTNPDDQKFIFDEAERLKLPVDEIIQMDYIKSKLATAKTQREAEEGMPKGRGNSNSKAKGDVDYWLAKRPKADGTFETPEDPELATKVINARISKETSKNKFSEDLYSG